jgi:hypothetical protein
MAHAASSPVAGISGGGGAPGASSPGPGVTVGGGEAVSESVFRRRPLSLTSAAPGIQSCGLSSASDAVGTQQRPEYITPEPVLRAPGDQGVGGVGAQAVQGCLWPPQVPAAGSRDMDTPAGSQLFTHVRHTESSSFVFDYCLDLYSFAMYTNRCRYFVCARQRI